MPVSSNFLACRLSLFFLFNEVTVYLHQNHDYPLVFVQLVRREGLVPKEMYVVESSGKSKCAFDKVNNSSCTECPTVINASPFSSVTQEQALYSLGDLSEYFI